VIRHYVTLHTATEAGLHMYYTLVLRGDEWLVTTWY